MNKSANDRLIQTTTFPPPNYTPLLIICTERGLRPFFAHISCDRQHPVRGGKCSKYTACLIGLFDLGSFPFCRQSVDTAEMSSLQTTEQMRIVSCILNKTSEVNLWLKHCRVVISESKNRCDLVFHTVSYNYNY